GSSSQVGSGQVGAVMSALGQKRTFPNVRPMSALPPKADIRYGDRHVRFVPKADIGIAYRCGLPAGTRDEAAKLGVAVTVVIGPHNGRAETVGFSHNGVVRYHKPFSMNADTIMALLCVPIDVLHAGAVGKSAAQPLSAPKVLKPFFQRRTSVATVVTCHQFDWCECHQAKRQ